MGDLDSSPGLGRHPGGGHGNPLQCFCLENPHGQRSLAGYSRCGTKESDTTEWLSTHTIKREIPLDWWYSSKGRCYRHDRWLKKEKKKNVQSTWWLLDIVCGAQSLVVVGGLVTKLCLTRATPQTVAHKSPLSIRFRVTNTGVGCRFFLQGILTHISNSSLLHWTQSPALQADSLLSEPKNQFWNALWRL